jgi:hypothetical protein
VHRSCLCNLLERLHLLDALWQASRLGSTPAARPSVSYGEISEAGGEAAQEAEHEQPQLFPAAPFIQQLEARLHGCPGLDGVLAALIVHAQQNAAAGSKLAPALSSSSAAASKQEAVEVACMSAVQEQHSAARALPLLLRLYFNTGARAEVRHAQHACPLPRLGCCRASAAALLSVPLHPSHLVCAVRCCPCPIRPWPPASLSR